MKNILIAFFLLFVGCSHKINLSEYNPIKAPKAAYMPTKQELSKKKYSVLILDFDNNNLILAKKADIGKIIALTFKNELSYSNIVKIIQRLKKTNLKEEIKRSQIAKSLNIKTVDYIIYGKVIDVTYDYTYHKARYWKDKKGRVHREPPYISYKACVSANVELFSLKDFHIVSSFPISDCAYKSYVINGYYKIIKYNPLLIRQAAINAVNDKIYPLENFLAPKGYIEEIRKKDDEFIIKVTIGMKEGLGPGDDVYIYTIKKVKNKLTGENILEKEIIGKGIVSDNEVGENYAWIIVEKLKENSILHIGDFIKLHKSNSFFDELDF